MEILAKRLDRKLREWRPDIAESVRQHVTEIIDLARPERAGHPTFTGCKAESAGFLNESRLSEVY